MFRINIEEKLWSDPRFVRLVELMGNRFCATGAVVCSWILAQQYWIPQRELIPMKSWKGAGMPDELIEVGLAEVREDGVYVSGTEEHFAWWFEGIEQRRQAGIRSAESRRQKFGTAQPPGGRQNQKKESNGIERAPNEIERESNGIEPSSSSSSSIKYKETRSSNGRSGKPNDTWILFSHYRELLAGKGVIAVDSPAVLKQCKDLVKKHGLDLAKDLVTIFLDDDSEFLKKQAWPMGVLVYKQQTYLAQVQSLPRYVVKGNNNAHVQATIDRHLAAIKAKAEEKGNQDVS